MAGYTRQSTADIIPTATVRAAPINAEYNAIRDAFAASGGHKHDGTTGEGEYIPLIADLDALNKIQVDTNNNRFGVFIEVGATAVEQVRFQDGVIVPVTDNDIDLGTSALEFKNLYLDGTAKIDTLTVDENATIAGTLGVTGLSTLASVDINGGAIDGTTIGATSHTTGKFTTLQSTGQATLATVNIDGGTIDGTTIGATTATSGAFTTVSASTGFTGDVTGNLTGNVTGNVTGNLTGNVTGDLTGNVTAATGSSTFNNVTINGTLDVTSTRITNVVDPTAAQDAATKNYVDTEITNLIGGAPGALDTLNELAEALNDDANAYSTLDTKINTKVSKAGDTMTGALAMGTNKITGLGTPTANTDAATKGYVDTQRDTRLATAGGTMTGNISMGANKVTSTATPTAADDLTRKDYVDSILGSATAASASAAAAATSESNAATSETNAASSAASAAASYDSFDDRYLGSKASAPTVDNDSNALLTGALYWNSTDDKMYVYDGSSWNVVNPSLVGDASPQLGGDLDTNGNDITFGDNDKAIFGAGSDLQIYHDGANSFIDENGAGNFFLRSVNGASIRLYSGGTASSNLRLLANSGGEITLYHSGSAKLATTSTGVDVTGTVTADGLTVENSSTSTVTLKNTDTGVTTGQILSRINFEGSDLGDAGVTAKIEHVSNDNNGVGMLDFYTGSTSTLRKRLRVSNLGDISFYEDTGTTAKFFWDASAERLGIGTSSPSGELHVLGSGGGNGDSYVERTSGAILHQQAQSALGIFGTSSNHDLAFKTNGSVRMRIDTSGNVGIGTSSPSAPLHINGGSANVVLKATNSSNTTGLFVGARDGAFGSIFSAGDGYIYQGNGKNLSMTADGGGVVRFGTGSTERMRIDSSGNVGIGESNPATKLAVAGTTTTDGLNLDAIASTISDTAVDIFVYDTRKDSDGGAWRKRTQHTSWYNETLNTSTRGSRKEFPAVAVIVAENSTVTIYDGDDPDLPMWMVFNARNKLLYPDDITSVVMKNGLLASGGDDATYYGFVEINFISEETTLRTASTRYGSTTNISGRNTSFPYVSSGSTGTIVNVLINDVAMTVLPNAPIDAATGLPVPTIAVATDGGVSVIKDDGTVVDITFSSGGNIPDIEFTYENKLIFNTDFSAAAGGRYVKIYDIPSSDLSEGGYNSTNNALVTYTPASAVALNHSPDDTYYHPRDFTPAKDEINVRLNAGYQYTWTGVTKLTGYLDSYSAMVAGITSDYNTGWMNGDIKLATLSDTDDTDVTGSELVTNGTFDSNTSGWTASNATLSVDSGYLKITSTGGARPQANQDITTVVGKKYVITATARRGTCVDPVEIEISGINSASTGSTSNTTDTVVYSTFVATSTTHILQVKIDDSNSASGETAFFDNISVRLAEEDRSVNGNGLQVFGTVTKTPVATGADLVAYSGWAGSRLERTIEGIGSGARDPLCMMIWANSSGGGSSILMALNSTNYTNGAFGLTMGWSGRYAERASNIGSTAYSPDLKVNTNTWQFLVITRDQSGTKLYSNGEYIIGRDYGLSITSPAVLTIGNSQDGTGSFAGKLALARVSTTVPSPEQIKKIYEDEKVLFQDGAKAVLAGTSDAVTALAYDDDQQELLVGTSQYTSVFRGLRRVEEISGSASAISASNGLRVIED